MSHDLNPNEKFKVVQVSCASFLAHMAQEIEHVKVGFSLLGGKNPFELSDERAFDIYAITHMKTIQSFTTEVGLDITMTEQLAFGEGLERYFDQNLFGSLTPYLPRLADEYEWSLIQIGLSQIDPKKPDDIAFNDPKLLPIFSGQLTCFTKALNEILVKEPQETFCLLYQMKEKLR